MLRFIKDRVYYTVADEDIYVYKATRDFEVTVDALEGMPRYKRLVEEYKDQGEWEDGISLLCNEELMDLLCAEGILVDVYATFAGYAHEAAEY